MESQNPEEKLQGQIDYMLSKKTFEEVKEAFTKEEKLQFLKDYYLNENLDYKKEISLRMEDSKDLLSKELKTNKNPPYKPEVVDAMIMLCKMSIMDVLIAKVKTVQESLREKLKDKDIKDFKTTMVFQLSMGTLAMEYNKLLSEELIVKLKEYNLSEEKFMQQALPLLTGDFSLFFEIDNFNGLKLFETLKDKTVTEKEVVAYIKKTTEYSKMVVDKKLNPQTVLVFPNMVNHFLFNEFNLENVQILNFVMNKLKEGKINVEEEFYVLLFEEIFFIEKSRKIIFEAFQFQMQLMDSMFSQQHASNNTNNSEVYPGMMQGGLGNNLAPPDMPFDPAMLKSDLSGLESKGMPSMEDMAKAMENLDLEKFAEFLPEMEKMMGGQGGFPGQEPKKD